MTVKNLDHRAIFEGNVVMIKEDLHLSADRAEVTFASGSPSEDNGKSSVGILSSKSEISKNEITVVHAVGNVVLRQGEREVRSREAYYYQKEDKVILLGDPMAWEKDYQVTGSKITIYLRENRSMIEGSKVIIHPENEKSQ
jgi:lipopolysaccharide export system protein LptA